MFASFLSRDKSHPCLLLTSKEGLPSFYSPLDIQTLAVGTSDFTCCQRNHIFDGIDVSCDRKVTKSILNDMIESKMLHSFQLGHYVHARLFVCFRNWWLRVATQQEESHFEHIESFKSILRWNTSDSACEWSDQGGIPILTYAVLCNDTNVVQSILSSKICTKDRLDKKYLKKGIPNFGIPAKHTILHVAMLYANLKIVRMLLESGVNPHTRDSNGLDPLMYGFHFQYTLKKSF
jgi:hypothetical protein